MESTYGDRKHEARDPEDALAEVIRTTASRGGTVLIPAFAVGRTQSLLFHLYRLKKENRIPDLSIYVDSPMAIDATEIFTEHAQDHRLSPAETRAAFGVAHYVRTIEESRKLGGRMSRRLSFPPAEWQPDECDRHHRRSCGIR